MHAITYVGPDEVAFAEIDDPHLLDDLAVVVEVRLAGICGSDLHIYHGHGFSDDVGYALGHEAVGEVVQVGAGVRRFRGGDRVLVPASVGCLWCSACARGHVTACENRRQPWKEWCYGMSHRLPGSQAQFVAVPHADINLVSVPAAVSNEAAVLLTDNAPTAWYGCRRARIAPGDTVAVIGAGPVGQLAVQSALVMGASRVLAVEPVAHRLARAVEQGAEAVDTGDPKAHVRELTGGEGVDAVVEAVGTDSTIALATSLARHEGRVSVIGVSQNEAFPFRMQAAQTKELEFHIGLCSAQYELPVLLTLTAAGRLDPQAVVTHRLGLSEGVTGYATLAARADGVGKILLDTAR